MSDTRAPVAGFKRVSTCHSSMLGYWFAARDIHKVPLAVQGDMFEEVEIWVNSSDAQTLLHTVNSIKTYFSR